MFIIRSIIIFYCIWSLKLFLSQPIGLTCFLILLPTTPRLHGGVRKHLCSWCLRLNQNRVRRPRVLSNNLYSNNIYALITRTQIKRTSGDRNYTFLPMCGSYHSLPNCVTSLFPLCPWKFTLLDIQWSVCNGTTAESTCLEWLLSQ